MLTFTIISERLTMENEGVTGASAPEQVTVDWSKVSVDAIPADVIKQHPLYKSVLGESIERRQEIAELKKAVPPTPASPPSPAGESIPDPVREALDRVAKLEQALAEERVQNWRLSAVKAAELPEKFASRLVGTTYEEILADAKSIAADLPKPPAPGQPAPPPSAVPGNAAGNERDTTMLNRITSRMGSTYGVASPFDPGIQRQAGGGRV